MPAPIVVFLTWVGGKLVSAAASAVVSKLVSIPVDKALGIQVQGASVSQWGETMVLAIFAGGSLTPEPTFEQNVSKRFSELQNQVDALRDDLEELRGEMAAFKWQVVSQFYKEREETLWESMLKLENTADTLYKKLRDLGKSDDSYAERRAVASALSKEIENKLREEVTNSQRWFLGKNVGAGQERVRGLLELWQQMALRDADQGWDTARLMRIYELLEAKFTHALLIQLKCVRLLIDALEAQRQEKPTRKGGVDYLVDEYYPILRAEVEGFRDIVEALAINLMPLPTGQLLPFQVPEQIAGMLARLDMFCAQAMIGKLTDAAPAEGRKLPDAPALSGCWGRVVVPGTRWVRRAPGSKEEARVTLTAQDGRKVTINGTLEVRAVKYMPYKNNSEVMVHQGYQLQVGNELRDMDRMLMAHFTPKDVLPADLAPKEIQPADPPKSLEARLEDKTGELLAQPQAFVVPIPLDEERKTSAPFGTFMMTFTGGAGLRGR